MTDKDRWSTPLTDLSYQILLTLTDEPLHGYAILKALAGRTHGRLEPASGTLYTAIRRLHRDGLIATGGTGGSERRGRSYKLTEQGRMALRAETRHLMALVAEARRRRVVESEGGTAPA